MLESQSSAYVEWNESLMDHADTLNETDELVENQSVSQVDDRHDGYEEMDIGMFEAVSLWNNCSCKMALNTYHTCSIIAIHSYKIDLVRGGLTFLGKGGVKFIGMKC